MVDSELIEGGLFPPRVGDRLRSAREAAGYDLNDIGTRTRVPLRHLEAIERNDFSTLPSPTYAVGFVRAFARALNLDEDGFARDIRSEIGRAEPGARETQAYEPADPARVPPRLLAWTAAAIVLVMAIGYYAWRNQTFGETAPAPTVAATVPAPTPDPAPSAPPPQSSPAASASGQVVLTATAPVWLRISDAAGNRLYEKEMAAGERFEVPKDADGPKILTGRPDALRVTIDGAEVAPLGPPERTIADVGVSAAALAARAAGSGAPVASPPPAAKQ